MLLDFRDITVDYASPDSAGGQIRALNKLNLGVAAGEAVSVIGPSGCGKSTMLRLAAGLARPTEGEVLANGKPVEGARRDTAVILQDYGLLPWANVHDNAALGLKVRKVPRADPDTRARDALKRVGLEGFEARFPSELSGGMQQRLALARAIAMDVDLLLMDEPLSALDALLREDLQVMLLKLWKSGGYAQVLVTHSIEEAVFLGSRIVVMAPRPGRVVAQIANPGMGESSYRDTDEFFTRCREVREALAGGCR